MGDCNSVHSYTNSVLSSGENGGTPEAMEGRICQVFSILLQDLQKSHSEGESSLWQDGSSHPIRRFHACTYLFPPVFSVISLLGFFLQPFLLVLPASLGFL